MPATAHRVSQQQKLRPVRIKASSISDDGTFEGYGNVFNVVDTYGDIVLPGAFADSLAQHQAEGRLPKLLLQHDSAQPIGRWLEMREDDYGLYCKGQLLINDVAAARETHALLKAGALDALSIGGEPTETEPEFVDNLASRGIDIAAGGAEPGGQVRLVYAWHLWEVSVVTFPACAPALIDTQTVKRRPVRHDTRPRLAASHEIRALSLALAERQRAVAALRRVRR